MRGAGLTLALALWAGVCAAQPADVTGGRYAEPTTRYPHGALGDESEWGALELDVRPCEGCEPTRRLIRLPETRVFEDTAPRLVDVDGDGRREAVVVESDAEQGARLAIYGPEGLVAATPFIGQHFRWLAPAAVADLDGDGAVELAYVDRPHLAKVLRIWRFGEGGLTPVAEAPGLTNHRFGEIEISGGLRDCGAGPEIVLASGDWSRVVAARVDREQITTRDLGPYRGPGDMAAALACS
ncbi:FG-GAP repeat domain-containing protein [Histidinibacterium aquaticum]|uniref:VCBS repeat-containing protein n=1 Tax=Histidinibacterium aquaticum TaxID=2613962 RepID=A0A5J5GQZ2_9RHOB|nr:VCBS repeat-containing protein [Histidinibacterium aquaticum]KAA9009812.1 VCBS repeat-containing protein [Histidinibacterium aquaticum]